MENNQSENKRKPAARISSSSPIINELGKVPPQALDLEQAVLGAMMLEKNAVIDTIEILMVESFYDPKHQYIYGAIRELFGTSNPIDILTVVNLLKKKGELAAAGGAAYVSSLTSKISSTANVEYHARIIAEKFIKRELIRMSSEVIKNAYDDTNDVFQVLGDAEENLFKIAENNFGKAVDTMPNVVRMAIEEIENAAKESSGISGIPTGLFELDKITLRLAAFGYDCYCSASSNG
ncbi:MAG: DnaB-like helicase N-terminal domain-containing protein [Crocinitomicaceae bacterium]